jgi:hypothetical protein
MTVIEETKPPRDRRMVELKAMGYTAAQIVDRLKTEGYNKCSLVTVNRFLAKIRFDDPTPEFKEELLRRQLQDISLAEIEQRLKYRGQIISDLMPTKLEHKGELAITIHGYGLGDKSGKPKPDS